MKKILATTALSLTLGALLAPSASAVSLKSAVTKASADKIAGNSLSKIDNFVIIYLENRSFDEMFGTFSGANGLSNASATAKTQKALPNSTQATTLATAESANLATLYPNAGSALSTVNPINNSNGSSSGTGTDASPKIGYVDTNFGTSVANGPWEIDTVGTGSTVAGATGASGSFNPLTDVNGDLVHRYYEEQVQIDGGNMDHFIAGTHASPDAGGLVMSYYGNDVLSTTHLWSLASNYVLLDNFFHSAFGGSFLNHAFLVCSCAFTTDSNATTTATKLDSNGMPLLPAYGTQGNPQTGGTAATPASNDTTVSADGKYWINTSHSTQLRAVSDTANGSLVQPQTQTHIGDRLTAVGASWKYYSQWYKRALAETKAIIANTTLSGSTYSFTTATSAINVVDPTYNYPVVINGVSYGDPQYYPWGTIPLSTFDGYMGASYSGVHPNLNFTSATTGTSSSLTANYANAINFQWHHNPFAFFADLAPGSAAQIAHLQDRDDFLTDIKNNTLPNVAFYKPGWMINQHHGYSNLQNGDNEVQQIVTALQTTTSYQAGKMIIIITYDENGGVWDHVAPPTRDIWGPGTRVPAIVVSKAVKQPYIDSTAYDTGSILRTIEDRWNLAPLTSADANATPLTAILQ